MTRNRTINMLFAAFALAIAPLSADAFSAATMSADKPSVTSVTLAQQVNLTEEDNWVWDGPVTDNSTAGTDSTPSTSTDTSQSI
jgi:hypothetical protein